MAKEDTWIFPTLIRVVVDPTILMMMVPPLFPVFLQGSMHFYIRRSIKYQKGFYINFLLFRCYIFFFTFMVFYWVSFFFFFSSVVEAVLDFSSILYDDYFHFNFSNFFFSFLFIHLFFFFFWNIIWISLLKHLVFLPFWSLSLLLRQFGVFG